MREYTTWDRIKDFLLEPFRRVQWYFAERWLNQNFGKCDYWGDKLMELFEAQRQLDEKKKAIDDQITNSLK